MDQNLTGLIAANITLSQSWYALGINALAGPISAAIGALAVYKTTQRSQRHEELMKSQEIAKADRQIRRDLFAQLYSKKRRLMQLYFSCFESKIYSAYHQRSEVIIIKQKKQIVNADSHIKEQRYWKKYWIHRGHDLQDLLHAEEEQILKVIGLISVSFPETEELINLTSKINEIRTLIPPCMPDFEDLDSLENWKITTTRGLDAKIKDEYLKPLDDLMDFLQPYLQN
ncbi:MAG: hypothetical protein PHW87_04680 [Methanothrix sp.]|nr:hypothetical protein [Methanothrix sp.]